MNDFLPVPEHVGFAAKSLRSIPEALLQGGALARLEPGGGGPVEPHRHEHAHLFIVTSGRITIMMDGLEHPVPAHDSLLVPGGVLHAVWNRGSSPAEVVGLTLGDASMPPSP